MVLLYFKRINKFGRWGWEGLKNLSKNLRSLCGNEKHLGRVLSYQKYIFIT